MKAGNVLIGEDGSVQLAGENLCAIRYTPENQHANV